MKIVRITGQPDIPWTPEIQRIIDAMALGRISSVGLDDGGHVAEVEIEGATSMIDLEVVTVLEAGMVKPRSGLSD